MKGVILFGLFITISLLFSNVQDSKNWSDKAFEEWNYNNHSKVKKNFHLALEADKQNIEAYWGLILVYSIEENWDKVEEIFIKAQAENPKFYNINLMFEKAFKNEELLDNRTKVRAKELEKVIAKGNLTSIEKLNLLNTIVKVYAGYGKQAKAKKFNDQTGEISNWCAIGPFENIYGAAFDKTLPVQEDVNYEQTYSGKYDIPDSWRKIDTGLSYNGFTTKQFFAFDHSASVWNTYLYSENQKDYTFNIQNTGMIEVTVNDVDIHSVVDSDADFFTSTFYQVTLNPGWNKLTIKSGYSENSDSKFSVKVLDTNGNPIAKEHVSPDVKDYDSWNLNFKIITSEAEKWVDSNLESKTNDFLFNILKSQLFFLNNKFSDAIKTIKVADKVYPNNSLTKSLLKKYYYYDSQKDSAERLIEKIWNSDKDNVENFIDKIAKEIKKKDFSKAQQYLDQLEESHGKIPVWWEQKVYLLATSKDPTFKETVKEFYKAYPDNQKAIYHNYILASKGDNLREVKKYGSKLRYNDENALLKIQLAYSELVRGDYDRFKIAMHLAKKYLPYSSDVYYYIADFYKAVKMYDEAFDAINTGLTVCSTNSDLLLLQAKIYIKKYDVKLLAKENENVANKIFIALKRAIKFDPHNIAAMNLLRDLEGKERLYDLNKVKDLESYRNLEGIAEKYKDEDAAFILLDKNFYVHEGGLHEEFGEMLIQILSEKGVEEYQEMSLNSDISNGFVDIDEATIYKKDGTTLSGENLFFSIVFKQLEIGDQIYVKYRNQSMNYGHLRSHFFTNLMLQKRYPVNEYNIRVTLPQTTNLAYKVIGYEQEPIIDIFDDLKRYSWKFEEINNIDVEYNMPNFSSILNQIQLSTIPNWNYLVKWYNDISRKSLAVTPEIQDQVDSLFADQVEITDFKKINLIYDFITSEINYSSNPFRQNGTVPQKSKKVLNSRLGDCKDVAALAITMAKAANISAHFMLVDTNYDNKHLKYLPNPYVFNHAIVHTAIDKKDYFLDLTSDKVKFGTVSSMNAERLSLPIVPRVNNTFVLPKEGSVTTLLDIEKKVKISQTLKFDIVVKESHKGNSTSRFLAKYEDLNEEDQLKELQEALSSSYKNIDISDFNFNIDELNTVHVNKHLTSDGTISKTGKFILVSIPWELKFLKNKFVSYQERELPISEWDEYRNYDEDIEINIPGNCYIEELPEQCNIDNKFFNLSVSYSKDNNIIKIHKSLKIKENWISVDDYALFKNDYLKAQEVEKAQIILKAQS